VDGEFSTSNGMASARNLSTVNVISEAIEHAFSSVQLFSSGLAFIGFDEFVREVGQPVRNTAGLDLPINVSGTRSVSNVVNSSIESIAARWTSGPASETAANVTRSDPSRHLPRRLSAPVRRVRLSSDRRVR